LSLLDDWSKPEEKQILPPISHLADAGGTARVYKEPLGVVLIISPWNVPLLLLTKGLIGAIGAGNSVVIKPSEVSNEAAKLIGDLFPK
jgi:acyl-CoA reductase-like NAD-dependent aldehyde dehydrogenase